MASLKRVAGSIPVRALSGIRDERLEVSVKERYEVTGWIGCLPITPEIFTDYETARARAAQVEQGKVRPLWDRTR